MNYTFRLHRAITSRMGGRSRARFQERRRMQLDLLQYRWERACGRSGGDIRLHIEGSVVAQESASYGNPEEARHAVSF